MNTAVNPATVERFNPAVLKERRESLGFSQLEVAKLLYPLGVDVTQVTVSNWERGEAAPNADDLPKLAAVLKLTVRQLYTVDTTKGRS